MEYKQRIITPTKLSALGVPQRAASEDIYLDVDEVYKTWISKISPYAVCYALIVHYNEAMNNSKAVIFLCFPLLGQNRSWSFRVGSWVSKFVCVIRFALCGIWV